MPALRILLKLCIGRQLIVTATCAYDGLVTFCFHLTVESWNTLCSQKAPVLLASIISQQNKKNVSSGIIKAPLLCIVFNSPFMEKLWLLLSYCYFVQVISPTNGDPNPELELYPISLRLFRHSPPPTRGGITTWTGVGFGLNGFGFGGNTLTTPHAPPKRYLAYVAAFSRMNTIQQVRVNSVITSNNPFMVCCRVLILPIWLLLTDD